MSIDPQNPVPGPVPPPVPQEPKVRYTYTDPAPPRQPHEMPVPPQPPARMYSYQQPSPVRPMTVQPMPAPMSYKMVKKKSKVPFVLTAIWLVLYFSAFRAAGWMGWGIAGAGALLVFGLSKWLVRDRQEPVPLTREELARMEAERREAQAKPEEEKPAPEVPSSCLPKEAQEYLQQIREADAAIEDEAVSEKIRKLEIRTQQIFQVVSKNPEKLPEIRKFMSYYLPTLLKLLRSYDHLEEQELEGENIRRSMQDIEHILDTVIVAFDKQLDNLFEAEALDISSDIQVLETMLSQEGLIQNDFFKDAGSSDKENPDAN